MKTNFEIFKTILYNYIISMDEVKLHLLLENLQATSLLSSYHSREKVFKDELNLYLDRMDIRMVENLLVVFNKAPFPKWMKFFNFHIDYNKDGVLDLIKNI